MSLFLVLIIVAAILLILSFVLKNWTLAACALAAVILALIFGRSPSTTSMVPPWDVTTDLVA